MEFVSTFQYHKDEHRARCGELEELPGHWIKPHHLPRDDWVLEPKQTMHLAGHMAMHLAGHITLNLAGHNPIHLAGHTVLQGFFPMTHQVANKFHARLGG